MAYSVGILGLRWEVWFVVYGLWDEIGYPVRTREDEESQRTDISRSKRES